MAKAFMRVFVTETARSIGSAVVQELIGVSHQVPSLAHSRAEGKRLIGAGPQAHCEDIWKTSIAPPVLAPFGAVPHRKGKGGFYGG